ncbi:MAG TPA: hypothetical protein V6D47_14890 [Oscillatoriaceae cyanobacterium]
MAFEIYETEEANAQRLALQAATTKREIAACKAVQKAIRYLAENPRHPGLNTHEYDSLQGANGERVWEAYAENATPGAYRIFWHYGPGKGIITIIAITPHP